MAGEIDEQTLQELYSWVDKIPLSRPKRNVCRDFSDGVLTAEVVKNYFPKLVEMHNYVPANSAQQKVSNWTILNRKVFSKLNFSVPDDLIRRIVQCSPGVVELVLSTLRQKIEERQRQIQSEQEVTNPRSEPNDHSDPGNSPKQKSNGADRGEPGSKPPQGYAQAAHPDSGLRMQLAEKERALMASQETIQILQAKLRRMEQLLHLKNVRIDDLSRRLQDAEKK
ncbi:sperm flagellar protein 1 [Bufo gargarizans]|uniref:sperm flagellar protein 1 n=1 Tax=Bufo gargarizans TaxID=30331 RepID=UPI001CF3ADB8|nr:sperm flagellar protein 1 [Bufo gargarizans]